MAGSQQRSYTSAEKRDALALAAEIGSREAARAV